MEKVAVFPGTFDPITLGHVDIIKRALPLVDKLFVGIGVNRMKNTMFPLQQRIQWIKKVFEKEEKVYVVSYDGLTVDFCKENNVDFIVRGVRTVKDFEYEKTIADMNRHLVADVETIVLFSSSEYGTLASTLVRDVLKNEGDVSPFLPKEVVDDLEDDRFIEV